MSERTYYPAPQAATPRLARVDPNLLLRKCACGGTPGPSGECAACRSKRLALQRRASQHTGPSSVPPVVHEVLGSPGRPLDPTARAFMESRFGHDFGRVRIHTDARAAQSARAVRASAYTVGQEIVFGAGQYAPKASQGQHLLAHELTHVVQQNPIAGRRSSNPQIGEAGTPLELEADRMADAVVSSVQQPYMPTRKSPAILQRACPRPPTGLGNTLPSEPCDPGSPDYVAGKNLQFCQDSDELLDGQTTWVNEVIADARRATRIELHGNASMEGPPGNYNRNLACKRAVAIATRLRGSGDTTPIALFSHGPTSVYGSAEANRNVVAVLTVPSPPPPPGPSAAPVPATTPHLDQQVYCITYVRGGCPQIVSGGVPGEEEITRHDTSCRADTGYAGPPVTLADLHCEELGLGIALSLERTHPGWKSALPPCPCTAQAASIAGWSTSNTFLSSFHPGAATAYRRDASGSHHAQQCCYDDGLGRSVSGGTGDGLPDGRLITEGAGAGTPDFWSSSSSFFNHQRIDVEPWRSLGWERYNQYWTPDNANGCPRNRKP